MPDERAGSRERPAFVGAVGGTCGFIPHSSAVRPRLTTYLAPEHSFQRHDGQRCAMKPSIRPSAIGAGLSTIHPSIGKEEPLAWIIYNLRCFTLAFAAAIWLDWADAIIPAHCTKPTNSVIPPMPFCIASIVRRYTAATGE